MKKRTYKQNCSLAFASDLLGERWTLLLFRELLIQPCRFKQLNLWLKGMGTNLLTNRLKELEQDGLIEKQQPENKRSAYQLTQAGYEVEHSVLAMIRWGYRYGHPQEDFIHYAHWDLLAMKAFYDQSKGQKKITLQFSSVSLLAWVTASGKGFDFGMGVKQSADIEIGTNIIDFQVALERGDYIEDEKINAFLQWFDLPDLANQP